MSSSDSDSDAPLDVHDPLGLSCLSNAKKLQNGISSHEEIKGNIL